MPAKTKVKIEKIIWNPNNSWAGWDNLRNDDGVVQALREAGKTIGEIDTEYKGQHRARVVVKSDRETLKSLGINTKY